jgi:hypothetical protein
MKEIDDFLEFLMDFIYDDRVKIYKRIKYGHRIYHIDFEIDEEKHTNYPDHLRFIIDNRNVCIEIISPGENNILFCEDKDLVDKWSNFCEEYLVKELQENVKGIFETSLQSCFRKDIHREYQLRKLSSGGDDSLVSE